MPIATINPATGETLKTFEQLSDREIDRKLKIAAQAFSKHRRSSFAERAQIMQRAAEILEGKKEAFARMMTTEMGKTFRSAVEEAVKCAWVCRFYAENGEAFLADEVVATPATRSYVRYQPLGPVLAVMPWNYPFWQVM
jgi:succinate-semialdehyde dehydrogenase/glutarate-semialdehyde dehydrogenase